MLLLIVYIVIAIGVSFLCSIMEAVLLSVTPGHLASMERSGVSTAPQLRRYKDNIDEPLAAILSLNTIAHTVGAAGAGAQAARVFGDGWLGLFSALLTLGILFLSEIIPKTIGAVYWKQLASPITRMLGWMLVPMKPFVWMSGLASGMISAHHVGAHVSREELSALADLGARQGVLDEDESRILHALLRFRSLRARDIMTPRTVTFALPADMTATQVVDAERSVRFSRIPIYDDSVDSLKGYVLKDDIFERVARDDGDVSLAALKRAMLFVPATTPLPELLERFLGSREHIASVVDEYGGTAGLVTLEDVVETLLDLEIVDEADSVEDLRAAARSEWERRARRLGLLDDATEA